MATRTLDFDLIPLIDRLTAVLDQEPALRQQQAIELLTVRFALRMGSPEAASMVIEGIHKHVRQLLEQQRGRA